MNSLKNCAVVVQRGRKKLIFIIYKVIKIPIKNYGFTYAENGMFT